MKYFRSLPLAATLLCLAVSISAGWLWHALSEVTYEAHARLALGGDPFAGPEASSRGVDAAGAADGLTEDQVLSQEVLAAAADLLRDRRVTLSLPSPLDSETDYLLDQTRVEPGEKGGTDEVRIVCTAPEAEESLQMLRAMVDAFLATAATAQPESAGSASDDLEREQRQLVNAIQRKEHQIAALDAELRNARLAPRDAARPDDDPVELESRAAAARRAVSEAQTRLDDARRDFEKNLPPDVVAARLPEGPARTKILDRLGLEKLRDELRRQEALAVRTSAVYGRNHPRMVEVREKIEQLRRQIAGLAGQAGELAVSTRESDPTALVLRTLERELAGALADARDIESLLSARNDRIGTRQNLEAELADARQELAFLHGEHDRLQRQLDSARREEARRLPAVVEPPTLSPDPVAPQAGLQMAVSCVAGMALYLFLLWHLRSRLPAPAWAQRTSRAASAPFARTPVQGAVRAGALAPPPVQSPRSQANAPRKERSRSQDEQRLARLKMLSSGGATPVKWD